MSVAGRSRYADETNERVDEMAFVRETCRIGNYVVERHKCGAKFDGNKCTDQGCIKRKHRYWVVNLDGDLLKEFASAAEAKAWAAGQVGE